MDGRLVSRMASTVSSEFQKTNDKNEGSGHEIRGVRNEDRHLSGLLDSHDELSSRPEERLNVFKCSNKELRERLAMELSPLPKSTSPGFDRDHGQDKL